MARKEVVAKRGCTCCGTGCVLMTAIVPAGIFAAFETLGVIGAVLLWPSVIAAGHGARFVSRRSMRRSRLA